MTDKPDDKDTDKPDEKLSLDDLIAEAEGKKPEKTVSEKPAPEKPAPDKPAAPTPPPPPVKDAGPPEPPTAKPADTAPATPPKSEVQPPPKSEAKPEVPPLPPRQEAPPAKPAPPPPLPSQPEAPPVRPAAPPPKDVKVTPPGPKPPLPKRDETAGPIGPPPRAEKPEEAKPAPAKLPAVATGPLHLVLLAASWFVMLAGIWSNWALVGNPWLKIGLVLAPAVALIPSIVLWRNTSWTFKTGLSCLMATLIGLTLWAAPLGWWKDPGRVFNLLDYPGTVFILVILLVLSVVCIALWWGLFKRYKIVAAVLTVITLYSLYPLVYALGQEQTLSHVFNDSVWLLIKVPWWIDPLYLLFEVVLPLAMLVALVTYFIRLFGTRKAQVFLWTFLILAAASATGFAFLNTVPRQGKVLPHLLSHTTVAQHLRIPSLDDRVQAVKRQVADMTAGFFFVRGLDRLGGDAVQKLDQNLRDAAARRKRQLMDIDKKLKQMDLQKKRLLDMKKRLQQEGAGGQSSSGAR